MIIPETPINEKERIEALRQYNILDTLPEKDYDDLTQLASEICDTPISLVTLIDPDRQWFKSRHGIEITETPREIAFCAHAINEPEDIFIVPDLRKDDRFSGNPFVVGEPNVVFYAGVPLVNPDGFALGTLCIIDVEPKMISSGQKEALKVLANQVVKLMELRKVNIELKKRLNELSARNEELEQFVYVATHDLKEPLNNILNFSSLLAVKRQNAEDEQEKIFLKFITESGQRLNARIDELLAYARIGKSKSFEEVDLNDLLDNIQRDINSILESKDVTLNVKQLPVVRGIRTDLYSLFQNLISNGIKYARDRERVVIDISVSKEQNDFHFIVKDNGIGFDNKYKDRIFLIFQRLHDSDQIPGTGIGLANCKKIIEVHKGKIWAESEEGKGSEFHFTIPT